MDTGKLPLMHGSRIIMQIRIRCRLRTPSEGPLNLNDIDLNQDGHFIELKTSRVIDSPRLEAR